MAGEVLASLGGRVVAGEVLASPGGRVGARDALASLGGGTCLGRNSSFPRGDGSGLRGVFAWEGMVPALVGGIYLGISLIK